MLMLHPNIEFKVMCLNLQSPKIEDFEPKKAELSDPAFLKR